MLAKDIEPFIQPESGDRRFNSPLWQEQPNFDLLSQSYLLFSQLVQNMVDVVERHSRQSALPHSLFYPSND